MTDWKRAVGPFYRRPGTGKEPRPVSYQPMGRDPAHGNAVCCGQGPGVYQGEAHVLHPESRYCCCGEKRR